MSPSKVAFIRYKMLRIPRRQNNVEELFSLLQFLRIRPLNDWDTFNTQINKPVKSGRSVRAMKRLQVRFKDIVMHVYSVFDTAICLL